jgi:hypothetical protein
VFRLFPPGTSEPDTITDFNSFAGVAKIDGTGAWPRRLRSRLRARAARGQHPTSCSPTSPGRGAGDARLDDGQGGGPGPGNWLAAPKTSDPGRQRATDQQFRCTSDGQPDDQQWRQIGRDIARGASAY